MTDIIQTASDELCDAIVFALALADREKLHSVAAMLASALHEAGCPQGIALQS
jgi:hypothetical protein